MSIIKIFLPVCLACLFNALANAFWKMEFAKKPFEFSEVSKIINVFMSFNIIIGILFYVGSMLLFFYMLSNFKLSVIIPLTSLTYLFNLLSAYLIFHERISAYNIIGSIIVVIGIVVLSQSPLVDKV